MSKTPEQLTLWKRPAGRPRTQSLQPKRSVGRPRTTSLLPKKPVGRPRKYHTEEERLKAQAEQKYEYWKNNPDKLIEKQRRAQLRIRYNITLEQKETMWLEQNKQCAICRTSIELWGGDAKGVHYANVDHNHDTGQVRGLLCGPCNGAVGCAESKRLKEAQDYVALWNKRAQDVA